MEAAIVVVDANETTKDQTREHLLLCRQNNVEKVIAFINKCEYVPDLELLDLLELTIRDTLNHFNYNGDNAVVIRGSALCALKGEKPELGEESIAKLLNELDSLPEPKGNKDHPFLLYVESVYKTDKGCVVTGTVDAGQCKVGDDVQILGINRKTKFVKIVELKVFKKNLELAIPGDFIGLLLSDVDPKEIQRGMAIVTPNSQTAYRNCQVEAYMIPNTEGGRKNPIFTGYRPIFYMNTATVPCKITLPEDIKMVLPGDNCKFNINLYFPLVLKSEARFSIREGGKTIFGGIIQQLFPDTEEDHKEEEKREMKKTKK